MRGARVQIGWQTANEIRQTLQALANQIADLKSGLGFVCTDGITAAATPAQGKGVLTATVNRVTTIVTDHDCVTLPEAVGGRMVIVMTYSAQTLDIYPALNDRINAAAVNVPLELAANQRVALWASSDINWWTIPS